MKKNSLKLAAMFAAILLTRLSSFAAETNSIPRLSEVVVKDAALKEETPVGPYQQPDWTTQRRFATTRVYLQQQPWCVGVEQWVKAQWPRKEGPNFLFQEEVEIGLPHRFQFDLYENWARYSGGIVQHDSVSTELRYALADWGKILGNPTLYAEWTFSNHAIGADKYEVKLLLGDEITPRWHWGFNAVFEQEVGQSRTREYQASAAISYTLIDQKLSAGLELKVESEAPQDDHPKPVEVDLGPSIQWRPTHNSHLDVVPLVGLSSDSPHVELWIVFGFDFGSGSERGDAAPVSTRSK
jgi:hypothetical protein